MVRYGTGKGSDGTVQVLVQMVRYRYGFRWYGTGTGSDGTVQVRVQMVGYRFVPGERLSLAPRPDGRPQVIAVEAKFLQRGHTEPLSVIICGFKETP
jgi:hypothetical protein